MPSLEHMIPNLTISITLMQFGSMMQIASIDGQVRDAQTHKPLAMVRIELYQQGIPSAASYTDTDGRFRFPNVYSGRYMIYADSVGYEPQSIDVDSMMFWGIDVQLNRNKDRVRTEPPVVGVNDLSTPRISRIARISIRVIRVIRGLFNATGGRGPRLRVCPVSARRPPGLLFWCGNPAGFRHPAG